MRIMQHRAAAPARFRGRTQAAAWTILGTAGFALLVAVTLPDRLRRHKEGKADELAYVLDRTLLVPNDASGDLVAAFERKMIDSDGTHPKNRRRREGGPVVLRVSTSRHRLP